MNRKISWKRDFPNYSRYKTEIVSKFTFSTKKLMLEKNVTEKMGTYRKKGLNQHLNPPPQYQFQF